MATAWKQIIKSNSIYDEHGLKERRLDTGFYHIRVGFSALPLKDDEWAYKAALEYHGFDNPIWMREQGINYKALRGQRIWPMLSKEHNARVDISDWTLFRVIDQGIRHPTVCLWVAVNAQGDRHIYREYYATNRTIALNCRAILSLTPENEKIMVNYIDPSTRKRNEQTLKTLIQVYEENDLYCYPADNSFAGYDAVANAAEATLARRALRSGQMPKYLTDLHLSQEQLLILAAKPALTFDLRFASRSFEECCNLRWQETKGDETQKAPKEKPIDREDDGPDCVRYAIQSPLHYRARRSNTIKIKNFEQLFRERRKQKEQIRMWDDNARRAYS